VNPDWVHSWGIGGSATLSDIDRANLIGYHIRRRDSFHNLEWLEYLHVHANSFSDLNAPLGYLAYQLLAQYTDGISGYRSAWVRNTNKVVDTFPWVDSFEDNDYFFPFGWELPARCASTSGWRLYTWCDFVHLTHPRSYAYNLTSWSDPYYYHDVPNYHDNILISPKFILPEISETQSIELRYWIASGIGWCIEAERETTPNELYTFYVSTTDKNFPDSFDELFSETIAGFEYIERIVPLSDFAGQNIYFAIRHHEIGNSHLRVDDFSITIENSQNSDIQRECSRSVNYLHGSYPNPFNPDTNIHFTVGSSFQMKSLVQIDIYNIKGQLVRSLVDGEFASGKHSVVWDGTDDGGRSVGSGVYLYRIVAGEFTATKKMVLMK
jgi:hypothetical protein